MKRWQQIPDTTDHHGTVWRNAQSIFVLPVKSGLGLFSARKTEGDLMKFYRLDAFREDPLANKCYECNDVKVLVNNQPSSASVSLDFEGFLDGAVEEDVEVEKLSTASGQIFTE